MSATIHPYGKAGAVARTVGPGVQYTESFTLGTGLLTMLGYIVQVTVANTGSCTITVQTGTSAADDAIAADWTDCATCSIENFSLTALNTLRQPVTDPVLDKVRLKITGNATASGTVTTFFAGDQPIT